MNILDVISARRSIKQFTDRPISNESIEQLLSAAVLAPNHRMTEPWRFYVMGPEARAGFCKALGLRKAKRVDEPDAKSAVIEKVQATHRALPAMLAVATTLHDNPEIREEDYAATYMAIQNLCLAAHSLGLGTHVKSGGVMNDPVAREAMGIREGERVIATIAVGEPAAVPDPKPRHSADEFTTWVP